MIMQARNAVQSPALHLVPFLNEKVNDTESNNNDIRYIMRNCATSMNHDTVHCSSLRLWYLSFPIRNEVHNDGKALIECADFSLHVWS
jgi:hypothetical protein